MMVAAEGAQDVAAVSGEAYARAGLLGNPSDGYGGKAIAVALGNFRATARITPAPRFEIHAGGSEPTVFPSLRAAADSFEPSDREDGLRLVHAAVHRFSLHSRELADLAADDERLRFAIGFETDIPRQVGLAGSSAIIIAVMRTLMSWFEIAIEPAALAELALAAEVEDLGLAGGAMDRVIQVYEGAVAMDLREPRSGASYVPVDPALLPPLFVAWDLQGGETSGKAHGALRARWDGGDEELRRIMQEFRRLVDAGVEALERGHAEGFRSLMNRNFELRSTFFPVSTRDREMISVARDMGAAAKLCGSGGAIVGATPPDFPIQEIARLYREAGFALVEPRVVGGPFAGASA